MDTKDTDMDSLVRKFLPPLANALGVSVERLLGRSVHDKGEPTCPECTETAKCGDCYTTMKDNGIDVPFARNH